MKRREKKLSVMDWVLVGLLDTLAGGRSWRADGNMAVAERLPLAWLLGNRRRMAACHHCNHHGGAADARIPDVYDFRRKEAW